MESEKAVELEERKKIRRCNGARVHLLKETKEKEELQPRRKEKRKKEKRKERRKIKERKRKIKKA